MAGYFDLGGGALMESIVKETRQGWENISNAYSTLALKVNENDVMPRIYIK